MDSTAETGVQYGVFGWLEHYREWGHRDGAWGVIGSGWRLQWHIFAVTIIIVSAPVYIGCKLMINESARKSQGNGNSA
jgi:hypothetical protein